MSLAIKYELKQKTKTFSVPFIFIIRWLCIQIVEINLLYA